MVVTPCSGQMNPLDPSMDDLDRASETEEQFRALATSARRPVPPAIAQKRALLAKAHALRVKHEAAAEPDKAQLQAALQQLLVDLTCGNCGDPLSLESDSVFCCPECAADWQARDRANRRNGL